MSVPSLPDLDPSLYRWHPDPSNPGAVRRLANGTEAWVGIKSANARGQYDFYIATTLRIAPGSSPVTGNLSLSSLKEHLALALSQIRHGEILCEAVWPEDGGVTPWIVYRPPKSEEEALERFRAVIETRTGTESALELRQVVEKERRGRAVATAAESVTVRLVANVGDEEAPIAEAATVEVLTRFNHVFWDGISARMMVGEMLARLGKTMEGEAIRDVAHVGELHLSEPILDACKVDVEGLRGDEGFSKAKDEFMEAWMDSTTRGYGLPVTDGSGTPRTEWYHFTQAQSEAIVRAVKTRIGPEYTISHLGHAATVMALLKARPLAPHDTTTKLVTLLPLNGRRYLRDELARLNYLLDEHAKVQYGACQAGAVVKFPNLSQWAVGENDDAAANRALKGLVRHVKESYDYWLAKPFQLVAGVAKDNFLSAYLSSTPSSFSGFSIPIFATDGVVDRYVPGEITDSSGNTLVTVEDCKFLLDLYRAGLGVRMESWKGATSLSLCFNEACFEPEDAAGFLKDMAGFMLAFAK